jgi:hypothetical protein
MKSKSQGGVLQNDWIVQQRLTCLSQKNILLVMITQIYFYVRENSNFLFCFFAVALLRDSIDNTEEL